MDCLLRESVLYLGHQIGHVLYPLTCAFVNIAILSL